MSWPKPAMLAAAAMVLCAATPPNRGELAVTVTDLRNTKGVVRVCMTSDPKAFPDCRKDPKSLRQTVPAAERVELMFRNVAPGHYAISLLHDENENGRADRALGMMPKEGFGFSRDAKLRMGPPSFQSAAFDFDGSAQVLNIRMRYIF